MAALAEIVVGPSTLFEYDTVTRSLIDQLARSCPILKSGSRIQYKICTQFFNCDCSTDEADEDAVYCYRCSVGCVVCLPVGMRVCMLATTVSLAKTAEPIDMPFGMRTFLRGWVWKENIKEER